MKDILNYGDGPKAIYEVLKKRIISGELRGGEEIKIMPLAQENDVSIVPVREAIRMLAAENLIKTRPRRSPIVTRIDKDELIEMYRIREALEPMLLEDAVKLHTAESVDVCRKILHKDQRCTTAARKVFLNEKLHLAMLRPSSMNRAFAIVTNQYNGIVRFAQTKVVEHSQMFENYDETHMELFKIVENGDVKNAAQKMRAHINEAQQRVERLLKEKAI